jgi:hypothetical protein
LSDKSASPKPGLGIRLLWFAALWASGVAAVGVAAFVLRYWLKA